MKTKLFLSIFCALPFWGNGQSVPFDSLTFFGQIHYYGPVSFQEYLIPRHGKFESIQYLELDEDSLIEERSTIYFSEKKIVDSILFFSKINGHPEIKHSFFNKDGTVDSLFFSYYDRRDSKFKNINVKFYYDKNKKPIRKTRYINGELNSVETFEREGNKLKTIFKSETCPSYIYHLTEFPEKDSFHVIETDLNGKKVAERMSKTNEFGRFIYYKEWSADNKLLFDKEYKVDTSGMLSVIRINRERQDTIIRTYDQKDRMVEYLHHSESGAVTRQTFEYMPNGILKQSNYNNGIAQRHILTKKIDKEIQWKKDLCPIERPITTNLEIDYVDIDRVDSHGCPKKWAEKFYIIEYKYERKFDDNGNLIEYAERRNGKLHKKVFLKIKYLPPKRKSRKKKKPRRKESRLFHKDN